MQINISGHHIDVTDPLKDYVNDKFNKLERHFDHITSVHVTLSLDKNSQKAESTIRIAGGELFAHATSEDMYAAIDQLVDKLDRQLLKHKEKTVSRQHGHSH